MAVLRGIQEKVHLPLYDSVFVRPRQQLRDVESSNVLKFFVAVHGKTKLETNMQASSLLPHWGTFETRALRVIISDLPSRLPPAVRECLEETSAPDDDSRRLLEQLLNDERKLSTDEVLTGAATAAYAFETIVDAAGRVGGDLDECLDAAKLFPDEAALNEVLELAQEVRALRRDLSDLLSRTRIQTSHPERLRELAERLDALSDAKTERMLLDQLERSRRCLQVFQELAALQRKIKEFSPAALRACVAAVSTLARSGQDRIPRMEGILRNMAATRKRTGSRQRDQRSVLASLAQKVNKRLIPIPEQLAEDNSAIFSKLIYNSVTTLTVGEKQMIQMPTWFFPSGAGPFSDNGRVVTHGLPTPEATFRFAEPVFIDTKQNFRVEIEIPEAAALSELQQVFGPLFIWVVLDGYRTREVQ